MWYKDMVSWGTLDPITSYVLSKKETFTRPVASDIARNYWENVDEISDEALEPERVAEWMRSRWQARSVTEEGRDQPQSEIPVTLTEDFSSHMDTHFRVLPAADMDRINWFDPAGYLLARSIVPENWQGLNISETDFILNPISSTISWVQYV
jgi:hypothetical protein